jgi:hypothetical protein
MATTRDFAEALGSPANGKSGKHVVEPKIFLSDTSPVSPKAGREGRSRFRQRRRVGASRQVAGVVSRIV